MQRRWSSLLAGAALLLTSLAATPVAARPPADGVRVQAAAKTRLTLVASVPEVD